MATNFDEGIVGLRQGLHPAVRAVVAEALARGVGETLATNVFFREHYGIGTGTLQRAVDVLADRQALILSSRGHLGRRIEALEVGQCWQAAGLAPIRAVLPPSGPAEVDILDQHLSRHLTDLGIPHTVQHVRGGARRLAAVSSGEQDFALVSRGTMQHFDQQGAGLSDPDGFDGPGLGRHRELAAGTYYAPGRLVTVARTAARRKVRLVAIDRDSADHVTLTRAEFPEADGFEYVDVPFPRVPAHVLAGRVDTGIWHVSASVVPLHLAGLTCTSLQGTLANQAWRELSSAIIVGCAGRPELNSVLAALPFTDLLAAQAEALQRETDEDLA